MSFLAVILKESFVAACRKDHELARRKKLTWAELGKYDTMSVAKASGNRFLLDLALSETPGRPRPFCEVRHVMSVVSLVEAGLGIAVVPQLALPPGDHPTLVGIPLVEPAVTRTIGLIRRRGQVLSPAAQELYEMIRASRSAKRGKLGARTATPRALRN